MFKNRFPKMLLVLAMLLTVFCFNVNPKASVTDAQRNASLKDFSTDNIIKYLSDQGYIVTKAENAVKLGNLAGRQFKNNEWYDITVSDTGLPTDFVNSFNEGFHNGFDSVKAPLKSQQEQYIGDKSTKKFHKPSCSSVLDMKEKNKVYNTKEYFINHGYESCKKCNP